MKAPLSLLLAALLAAPVRAAERKGVDVPAAPAVQVPRVPAALTTPALTPNAAVAALPQLPSAAAAVPALPQAAAVVPAAPAAQAQAQTAAAAAPAQAEGEGADLEVAQARALFDQAASAPSFADVESLVKSVSRRPLRGVFIQQEQEGSLLASDPRDSTGNVFKYYRPVEMRKDFADEITANLKGVDRVAYSLKRALRLSGRSSPYAAWDAWPLSARLAYLGALESAYGEKAWKGKVSLILERLPSAPGYLTKNPHMEAPPAAYKDMPGARFLQPELVSDKDHPAATVSEALGRTSVMIGDTGHAGTQYHVFVKAEPARLRAQLAAMQEALQLLNNALFAKAAAESHQNVVHGSLQPWHAGRSRRVADLLAAAQAAPHQPQAEDPDSEKHAFIGLRYWGMEDGKMVVSFELRGASLPWKARRAAARDMDTPSLPQRDYTELTRWLSVVAAYGELVAAGRAPRLGEPSVTLDAAKADAMLAARAAERGMPKGSYYGLADFSRRMTGASAIPPGYLFPFAAAPANSAALRALLDEWLTHSARMKSLDAMGGGAFEDQKRAFEYTFWSAYAEWAKRYEAGQRERVEKLFKLAAS